MNRFSCALCLLFLFNTSWSHAQLARRLPAAIQNPGFEDGVVGERSFGWMMSPALKQKGYSFTTSDDMPFVGKQYALLSYTGEANPEQFGTLLQSFDALGFRGKRIRFKAAVRTDSPGDGCQGQLWLRVDRPERAVGFFDNMGDRPVTANEWKHYEIVGDIADDAVAITLGLIHRGQGAIAIDDASFEVIGSDEADPTGVRQPAKPTPGLVEVSMATDVIVQGDAATARYLYPLPLSYRDQVPLTMNLSVDPPSAAQSIEVVEGEGENRILRLTLQNLQEHRKVRVTYRSVVLVAPSVFDAVPKSAAFPVEWPEATKPWLASTWCCEHDNSRIQEIAKEIRESSGDVLDAIAKTLSKAKAIFSAAKDPAADLCAVTALDKRGSCTSCANLVAAILRGVGIPARIVSGYPTWSGPLQTHYIVEAWVPDYGWYPVESTACVAPWPNFQQVNVSIVTVDYESKMKADLRRSAAPGVPYLSLTELEDVELALFSIGALPQRGCDHEARFVREFQANQTEWRAALDWAKPRWQAWLTAPPKLEDGKCVFGPAVDQVKATSLADLQAELN